MQLTPHFTLRELTHSATAARQGLANLPASVEIEHIRHTAQRMEQIRSLLGDVPITVLSCYRSELVNKAVGGSPTSAHRHGLACDFVAPRYGKPLAICQAIEAARAAGHITFDQLICEFPHSGGWVHIGFRLPPAHGRSQLLTAIKRDGRTVYLPGLQP
jgi:hypothetical protein